MLKLPEGPSKPTILKALVFLAEARQADVSKETLKICAAELLRWPVDLVENTCHRLAKRPRREGETAFPALGNLLEELQSRKAAQILSRTVGRIIESDLVNLWEHLICSV